MHIVLALHAAFHAATPTADPTAAAGGVSLNIGILKQYAVQAIGLIMLGVGVIYALHVKQTRSSELLSTLGNIVLIGAIIGAGALVVFGESLPNTLFK